MITIKRAVLEIDGEDGAYEIRFLEDISVERLLFFIDRYNDEVGPHGFVARQPNSDAPLALCLFIRSGHRICGRTRDDQIHQGKEPYT